MIVFRSTSTGTSGTAFHRTGEPGSRTQLSVLTLRRIARHLFRYGRRAPQPPAEQGPQDRGCQRQPYAERSGIHQRG